MEQEDRNAIFDLAKGLFIIIVIGATLGALYEAPWKPYSKVIVFGFMFLLGLIANEVSRAGNIGMKSMDALLLIFMQLNLMGKKQGVKQDQASKDIEEQLDTTKGIMKKERKLFGDLELWFVVIAIALALLSAYITTLLI